MSDKLTSLIEGVVGGGAPGAKAKATPGNDAVPAEGAMASQATAPKAKAGVVPMPPVATDPEVKNKDADKVENQTKKAKSPEDDTFEGDKTNPKQGSSKVGVAEDVAEDEIVEDAVAVPETKGGMAKLIFELVRGLEKEELDEKYASILNAILAEEDDAEYEDDEDEEEDEDAKAVVGEARRRLAAEDVDVTEDIDAIMSADESLTEDFRVKASTLYEAAVVSRVNTEVDRLEAAFRAEVSLAREQFESQLTEKVDGYLTYVVEEWMKENELAVERGLRTEITEDFISGLKGLFDAHYIEIPDEKVDVVNEMTSKIEELQGQLNESIEAQIDLSAQINEEKRINILVEAAADLTDNEAEKLGELASGVEFEDVDQYETAIKALVEGYFPNNVTPLADEDVDEDLVETLTEGVGSSQMDVYTNAIGRTIKK